MKIILGMNFTEAHTQIKLDHCTQNLWPVMADWVRLVVKEGSGDNWKPPNRLFEQPFPGYKGFASFMAGKYRFPRKKHYITVVSAVLRDWSKLSINETAALVDKIIYQHDKDKVGHSRFRIMTAFAVSTLRESFGNFEYDGKFLPAFTPDNNVRAIADAIIKEGQPDHPILADALEDMGWTHVPTLEHLRTSQHRSGYPCWSVYMALGCHPYQITS